MECIVAMLSILPYPIAKHAFIQALDLVVFIEHVAAQTYFIMLEFVYCKKKLEFMCKKFSGVNKET